MKAETLNAFNVNLLEFSGFQLSVFIFQLLKQVSFSRLSQVAQKVQMRGA